MKENKKFQRFDRSAEDKPLKALFLLPITLSIAVLIAIFVLGLYWLQHSAVERRILDTTTAAAGLYRAKLQADAERLKASLTLLLQNERLQQLYRDRDRERLLQAAAPLFTRLRAESPITHLYFINADGTAFLRVHKPERFGDIINRETFRRAVRSEASAHGLELGPLGTFALRAVAPWRVGGRLIGYVEIAEEIDHVIHDVATVLDIDIAVLIDKEFLDYATWREGLSLLGRTGDWERYPRRVVVDSTTASLPATLPGVLSPNGLFSHTEFTNGSQRCVASLAPLHDASGRSIGELLLLDDITQDLAQAIGVLQSIGGVGVLVGLLLLIFFYRLIMHTERTLSDTHRQLLDEARQRQEQQQEHILALESERVRLEEARQALSVSEQRLSNAQRVAHLGHWEWNIGTDRLYWSDEIYRIFGILPGEFEATYDAFIRRVHPHDREPVRRAVRKALSDKVPIDIEHRIVRPNGEVRTVHEQAEILFDASDSPAQMVGTVQDVTEHRQLDSFARRVGRILDESANEIYIVASSTLRVLEMNRTAAQNLRISETEEGGLHFSDIAVNLPPEALDSILNAILRGDEDEYQLETVFRRRDGTVYPVEVRFQCSGREMEPAFIAIGLDISERVSHRRELEYQALHDGLTGLPNRTLLLDRLHMGVAHAKQTGGTVALMLIDVDHLKEYNDTLGHQSGDAILKQTAERLRGALREIDTVARLAGDEFCALLPNVNLTNAHCVIEKVQLALAPPVAIGEMRLSVETRIGMAVFPEQGLNADALIRHADIALHQAKNRKLGYAIYDTEYDPFSVRRLMLSSHLRHAIEKGEFSLHYQPKVDLRTGQVREVEALCRWNHSQHGFIHPNEFIPLAEQTGFIRPLTQWVLGEALAQTKWWNDRGERLRISVNLSAHDLLEPSFVERVQGLLEKWQVVPDQLTLEITESAIMLDPDHSMNILRQFDTMGVRLAIDDYGTGYSSLAYLKQLPADELKIDKSFVTDMLKDENNAVITRSTIDLAHNLGLEVTAEGVESEATLELLAVLGCDFAQGYHCARPMEASQVPKWIHMRRPCLRRAAAS